jgi:hypothetical protein
VLDLTIAQHSSLVQLNSSAVDLPCKRDLVRMEVLPARFASDFVRQVAQDILDRVGDISDSGVKRQIYNNGLVVYW